MWIIVTLAAAFFQCVRTFRQRALKGLLSTNGANFVRYIYGAPLALMALALLLATSGAPLPSVPGGFWISAILGGLAQILATSALLLAITRDSFAVGTALSKTEALQAAIIAALFFGEHVGWGGALAIAAGFGGVALLTLKSLDLRALMGSGGIYGLISGFFFGWSAMFIRDAALAVPTDLPLLAALVTLASVTSLQTLMLGAWLLVREPGMVSKVLRAWRVSAPVAILSVLGSACWFLAFTLQKAAYVRALGQAELVFTVVASTFLLREKFGFREALGTFIITGSIVALLTLTR